MGILTRLQSFKYHKEQIETLVTTNLSAATVNIIAPIVFFLLFDDIPIDILYFLTASHFIVFIFRILYNNNLRKKLNRLDDNALESCLKIYLLMLFASGLLWAVAAVFTVMCTDILHVFILLTALITIISGAMAIVGSIYHATFIYIITIIPAFIFSLSYFGNTSIHYLTSAFLLLYMYIMLKSSFSNYKLLEDSLSQKHEIEILNRSLEQKVQQAVANTKHKEKLLEHQSRQAQMGEMISMIAHQWRQPLGSISSIIIDLQMKLQLETFDLKDENGRKELLEYLDKKYNNVSDYVQFLSTTIDDFRDFFKPDKSKKLVSLTEPIIRTLHIVETALLNRGIKITKDFQVDGDILLYHNEMTQVILNILKNSEDNFLEKNISNATISVSTKKENGRYIIYIADNGGGIPEDILPNIFDPYFSTKDEKNGTGLGLYMSKIMIEKHHGGKLNAYNKGDGVVFEIILDPNSQGQYNLNAL